MVTIYLSGSAAPKNPQYFGVSREITAITRLLDNFLTVQNTPIVVIYDPCGVIRLMWQTFCEINRFKLVESKNNVIYVDSALAKRSSYQFKHCVSLNLHMRQPSVTLMLHRPITDEQYRTPACKTSERYVLCLPLFNGICRRSINFIRS